MAADACSSIEKLSPSKKALLSKWLKGKIPHHTIPKRQAKGDAPLSFTQQRLWVLDQFLPDSSAYNMHDAVRIQGSLDVAALTYALTTLVDRHEILRTSFVANEGNVTQKISSEVNLDFSIKTLSHLSVEQREMQAIEIAKQEASRPFNLKQGSLFRVCLIQIAPKDHLLIWIMHHIVSDAWSLGIIIKEILALSTSFNSNVPHQLPELAIQYADFASWQHEQFQPEDLEAQLSFWRNELTGEMIPLGLPSDRPRPTISSYRGKRYTMGYSVELTAGLKQFALQEDVTLFMVLLAAFEVLLYRYTDEENFFIGVPVANRNTIELHDLIGYFSNTVVMKADLSGQVTFHELLGRVRRTALAVYEHQDIPFEQLVDELQPKRAVNSTPIFQVMFVLQNAPMPSFEQEEVKIVPIDIHNGTSKFDLLLNVVETSQGLQVSFEYSVDLFNEDTIVRMLQHYQVILEQILVHSEQRIDFIPIISEEEKNLLLKEWNNTTVNYPEMCYPSLSHLFESQVRMTPDDIAVSDVQSSISYQVLNARVNQLAHYLVALGIKPQQTVAVCCERSVELVVALLAILKTGAAYLPLDSDYPVDRLAYMLDNSKTKIILCDSTLRTWLDTLSIERIYLDEKLYQHCAQKNLDIPVKPTDVAYVIYTSGSTGHPKGVLNTQQGICNRLLWMQERYQLVTSDKVLQKTPYSFDVSVWEFFWPLIAGAQLVMAPPLAHRDSAWLIDIIQREQITTIHFVPSMLRLFVADPKASQCHSLQRVICSGEVLPYALMRQFQEQFTCRIENLYGPTEAAIDVSFWDCAEQIENPIVPIGRPIANTQLYILDRYYQPVPIGVKGELYLAGIGVGCGYLYNEALTQARFIPDPFSVSASATMYKTGDYARFLNNGAIEFLGRMDHQVKIRGVRIELQEVEAVLMLDPMVQSAVVVEEKLSEYSQLLAYVVPNRSVGLLLNEMSNALELEVDQWRMVFENTYNKQHVLLDGLSNIIGWTSSYTNTPLSEEEMEEWKDTILARIRAKKPRRILEVGCGTGLLLFGLAEECELYIGTDISANALAYIQEKITKTSLPPGRVQLVECSAHDLKGLEDIEPVDMVIMNSVVQYFPCATYLLNVLKSVSKYLNPQGCIFLGDIRNFALADEFYAATVMAASQDLSLADFRKVLQQKRLSEPELLISPEFFERLPAVGEKRYQAQILLPRGIIQNEMCQFRYQVFLECEKEKASETPKEHSVLEISWNDKNLNYEALDTLLEKSKRQQAVWVYDIPNIRVYETFRFMKAVYSQDAAMRIGELLPSMDKDTFIAVDPERLSQQWNNDYDVQILWPKSGNRENFDALFIPTSILPKMVNPSFRRYCNIIDVEELKSYVNRFEIKPSDHYFIQSFKHRLKKILPDYMIPTEFILLEEIPLTENGKIDRQYLRELKVKPITRAALKPAQTALQQHILDIWQKLFNRQISIDDDFFDSGGNSLLAAQMILQLREHLNHTIPLQLLFQYPTIERFSHAIGAPDVQQTENIAWTQMQQDAMLPEWIKLPAVKKDATFKRLFLTGATGFLGLYLLRDLLRYSSATVVCLIRCKTPQQGFERLKYIISNYRLTADIDLGRVEICSGDLAMPFLGLTEKEHKVLTKQIDAIYHCGATVNFIAPYNQLRDANVSGTLEILRLATCHHLKPIHLISSIYTLVQSDQGGNSLLEEHHVPQHGYELQMGYLQTKWVTENLALAARDRGIPINIYRPGRISGDTQSGVCQENDFFWGLINVCLLLQAIPETGFDENIIPVDVVSDAIVQLSLKAESGNQNYHLRHSSDLLMDKLLPILNSYGYHINKMPFDAWHDHSMNEFEKHPDHPAAKWAGFLFNTVTSNEPQFSIKETIKSLKNIGVNEYAPIDFKLLKRYIDYFIQIGFFPAPFKPSTSMEKKQTLLA
jgi:amino acid adenylation domain-containing protein/thioester reductase-like protein